MSQLQNLIFDKLIILIVMYVYHFNQLYYTIFLYVNILGCFRYPIPTTLDHGRAKAARAKCQSGIQTIK